VQLPATSGRCARSGSLRRAPSASWASPRVALATTAGRTRSADRTSSAPSSSVNLIDLNSGGQSPHMCKPVSRNCATLCGHEEFGEDTAGKFRCSFGHVLGASSMCSAQVRVGGTVRARAAADWEEMSGQETCSQHCSEDSCRCMRHV